MRYYIIAGERSGDLHGGNLIKAIKHRDPHAEIRGFGGDYMKEAGANVVVHYKEMAFMGFVEILRNLGKISRYIRDCKRDILDFNPNVVILIDYAGFNRRIASFGKKNGIRIFYYITPKVWAWHQNRALQLKATVDRMFVILPFEKDFFKKYNWDVDYVGNPVLDAVKSHVPDLQFRSHYRLEDSKPVIALLPGSRQQELKAMIPILAEVVRKFPDYQFAVAAINNLDPAFYNEISTLPNVVMVQEDTYNLLQNATAAIVTSGTATLETALFKVPQAVVYKTSGVTYRIVKMVIRVPFISLVNLIANKQVIKELIQQTANPDSISKELKSLVTDNNYRSRILNEYEAVYNALNTGSASENAARLMVEDLQEMSKLTIR
jgi:lipid-A-disaccharide synthase